MTYSSVKMRRDKNRIDHYSGTVEVNMQSKANLQSDTELNIVETIVRDSLCSFSLQNIA